MQRGSVQKRDDLRSIRQKDGLSQEKLAQTLGVSQSTVSRRERKPPQRHSDATYQLCSYAESKKAKNERSERRDVRRSFDEVWNKSDAHATALSKIIEAFVELCRSEHRDEEEPG